MDTLPRGYYWATHEWGQEIDWREPFNRTYSSSITSTSQTCVTLVTPRRSRQRKLVTCACGKLELPRTTLA